MAAKVLIPVVLFSVGIFSINVIAEDNMSDYAHFPGTYAFEATPYWPEFEIVKDGDGFRLQVPDSDWIDLILSNGALMAKEGEDARIKLSYNTSTGHLQVQVSYGPGTTAAEQRELVRLKSNPNDELERKYGIKAADLVGHVRDSEQWIHQVKSFQASAKDTWVKTPAGIEYRTKEVLAQFPDADLSQKKLWSLEPQFEGKLQIVFDDSRFRTYRHESERSETLRIWNGLEFVEYGNYFTHNQEYYGIRKEIPNLADIFVQLMWPRSKQHQFWWIKEQMENWQDWYGRAEDFILVGRQEYRGTLCYVLESFPKDFHRVRRWYVGVSNHLLYGDLTYEEGQLSSEHWTGDYKEVKPGWWFPMTQGYHLFNRDENRNSFIASTRDIKIEDVQVDQTLPNELFVMDYKDGVEVNDDRFGGFIVYKYKKDRTEEEWAEIRQKAQQRQESDNAEMRALDERIGQTALEFPKECKWVNTEPLSMEKLHGKAVVFQFWGVWCGPCHNYMNILNVRPENDNIIVIGIHTPEEDLSKIKQDMDKYKANGPVCVDIGDTWGTISGWYRAMQRPYWVTIGPDGKVVGHAGDPGQAFQYAARSLRDK